LACSELRRTGNWLLIYGTDKSDINTASLQHACRAKKAFFQEDVASDRCNNFLKMKIKYPKAGDPKRPRSLFVVHSKTASDVFPVPVRRFVGRKTGKSTAPKTTVKPATNPAGRRPGKTKPLIPVPSGIA
jgi:hypothetical protein